MASFWMYRASFSGSKLKVVFWLMIVVLVMSFYLILGSIRSSALYRQEASHMTPSREQSRDSWKIGDKTRAPRVASHTHRLSKRLRGRTKCVKTLHIFADVELLNSIPELEDLILFLQSSNETDQASNLQCGLLGYECDLRISVGMDFDSLRGKDAVIFGMVLTQYRDHRKQIMEIIKRIPESGQTWIYYSTEPPYRVLRSAQRLNVTQFKYHVLMSYDSKSDIHIPFGHYRPLDNGEHPKDTRFLSDGFYNVNRTGLISWVASNCQCVFWPRTHFAAELQKLLPGFDTYGHCGTNKCLPMRSDSCNKLFASYKFSFALPNSECHDYITEKFWTTSLQSGAVPVVVGAPKSDYTTVAPPNSFVHVSDFNSLSDLADYLMRVSRDDDLYKAYHEWRHHGEVVTSFPLKLSTMCRTIPHIYPRKPDDYNYLGDSPWYNGCRVPPSNRDFRPFIKGIGDWTAWR